MDRKWTVNEDHNPKATADVDPRWIVNEDHNSRAIADVDRRWIVNEKRNQRTGGNNTVAKPFLNEGAKIGTCRSTTR